MMSLNKRPDCGPRHLSSPPGPARWGPVGLHGPSQSEPPQSTARLHRPRRLEMGCAACALLPAPARDILASPASPRSPRFMCSLARGSWGGGWPRRRAESA